MAMLSDIQVEPTVRAGARAVLPLAAAIVVLGVSFGALAISSGLSPLAAAVPAWVLVLLWPHVQRPEGRMAAASGAAIACALVPFAPAGVPIVAAALGSLVGSRSR